MPVRDRSAVLAEPEGLPPDAPLFVLADGPEPPVVAGAARVGVAPVVGCPPVVATSRVPAEDPLSLVEAVAPPPLTLDHSPFSPRW